MTGLQVDKNQGTKFNLIKKDKIQKNYRKHYRNMAHSVISSKLSNQMRRIQYLKLNLD